MLCNNEKIIQNIDKILYELNIKFKKYPNRVSFSCPIHGGDKKDGVSLFTSGNKGAGNWTCWTNHCEEEYGKGIINFVRATLSVNEGKDISFNETIKWLEKQVGGSVVEEQTQEDRQKYKYITMVNELTKTDEKELGIPKSIVRQSLIYPAEYFLERGFTIDVLDKYDVGFCDNKTKQMYNRVVVPVYDDIGNTMIGCVGRTIHPQCVKCEKYHCPKVLCPVSSYEEYKASKWINSEGFNAEKYLYNLWNVTEYINLYNTVILTEGQGDVWRLEEANIHIGLGLFGSSIKDSQILKLEKLPILNIIVATDNDIAGLKCKEQILERLSRTYNVIPVTLPKHDLGEMTVEEVKAFFKPILAKYNRQEK